MRIQLLDYDFWNEWARLILESAGYIVTDEAPDLVLVNLENMNSVPEGVKFVVLCSVQMQSIRTGFKMGAVDCLPKPYGERGLLSLVGELSKQ